MAFSLRVWFMSVTLALLLAVFYWDPLNPQAEVLPEIELAYWGPGNTRIDDKTIRPFKINISDTEINELKDKLELASKLTPPLEGIGFDYGTNTDYLQKFVNYWKTKYNWREREVFLNKYPQFLTEIGGLKIHFLHVKPDKIKAEGKEVVPLLLVHGWPGSIREFYEIIPFLMEPRVDTDFVFELVIPSLPGYGFSQPSSKIGMGVPQIGTIFNELMSRLGFEEYYYQGGDWGASVGLAMSVLFPDRVLGFHSNFCLVRSRRGLLNSLIAYLLPKYFVEEEIREEYIKQFSEVTTEFGYFHLQATKPDTVGVALTDSPVGLAAYILEKFSTGTSKSFRRLPNGGLDKFTEDTLLDNIMIYWLSKSITTAIRLYSEAFVKSSHGTAVSRSEVKVPTACARFKDELIAFPRYALEAQYVNLKMVSDYKKGGHFIALEEPQLLADDIWKFLKIIRHKVAVVKSSNHS